MTNTPSAVVRSPFVEDFGEIWRGAPGSPIEDLPVTDIAKSFKRSGALLFRNFAVDTKAFKSFTDALCPDFMGYEGGASARKAIDGNETILTVTEPSMLHGIPLHGEMFYTKTRPKVLFFYCERPAEEDGETTVADGIALFKGLSAPAQKYFLEHKVKYVCSYPDGRWQQLFQTESPDEVEIYARKNDLTFRLAEDNAIVTEYCTVAVSLPLYKDEHSFINNIFTMVRWEQAGFGLRLARDENGLPFSDAMIDELQRLEAALTIPVAWEAGDVLMVDNTRMLHGRRAFKDLNRSIFVRLGGELRA